FRIVMLWALVVLSPLPYVLNLLPQGKKYGGRWWSMFGEYLTVGPVLAFFLWLALVSVGSGNVGETFTGSGGAGTSGSEIAATRGATGALPTSAADPRSLISFVIGICMLIAGLKITGEMGVIGASAASGAVNKFGSIAKGAAKKFTGYRYASERVGGAWAMRESARKERAQAGAAKLYGAYGTALAAPGRGIDAIKNKIPQRLRDKIPSLQSKAQDLQREAAAARAVGDLKTAKSKERQARWVNRTSTAVGIGWKAGMVGLAPVTGGASLLGLAPAAIRQMQKGGAAAESAGRDYKYKEVSKALDAMKDTKPNDVQKQIDDQSKPGTERMAAFLKATQDGLLDPKMVEGGEDFLQSLGADKKTISTFKSYAEKGHYAGTMLKGDRPDRQKRIREGRMPTKDLNAKEFEGDKGSLAADFVVHGNDAQRKELGNSKALKEAYKKGVQDAAGTAKDPDDKQKLQAELMRLGGDKATGQTAFQISGMDAAALGKALQSSQSSDILANIDEKDLAIDPATGTSAVLDAIVKNVNPARLNAAIGSAKKPDADPQASVNMAALQDAIKNSKGAKNYEAARSPVRGAESDVASVQKNLEKQQAVVRRSPAGSPQRTAAYSVVQRLQGDLTAAQNNLTTMQQQFEDQMKNVQKMEKQEQQLYEAMKRSKGK
ncbi:MAG: hypothetical protein Q7S02_00555, partial [bacterium]|nr:hypothetical protein [bacterium]